GHRIVAIDPLARTSVRGGLVFLGRVLVVRFVLVCLELRRRVEREPARSHAGAGWGVCRRPGGTRAFHPAPGPNDGEGATALATICRQGAARLMRPGREPGGDGTGSPDRLADESPVLAGLIGASGQGRVALGPRGGARVRRLGDARDTAAV